MLGSARERDTDALAAMIVANRESVNVASPPIPARNHGPDNLPSGIGNQQGGWRSVGDQALNVPKLVELAGVTASRSCP